MFLRVTLSDSKFERVMKIVGDRVPRSAAIEYIDADWNNADDHQSWLDTASEQEIADWLVAIYVRDADT